MGSIIVPEMGIKNEKLTAIPGTPPNLKNPPSGCRFAARCKYARPECKALPMFMKDFGEGREYRCIMTDKEIREVYSNDK